MKKLLSMILVLSLVLGMSLDTFAASATVTEKETQDIEVTAQYNTQTDTPEVFSVDIAWDDMTFTYNESGTKTWDASNHTYTTTMNGSWDKTTANVVVTNHSNKEVAVEVTYQAEENTGVTGTITNGTATLEAGVENGYDAADKLESTLTIAGKPNETGKIGTITITLN